MATINLAARAPAANDFALLVNALAEVRTSLLNQISDFLTCSCAEQTQRPSGSGMHDLDYPYGCELRQQLTHVDNALGSHLHLTPAEDFYRVMAEADADRAGTIR